MFTAIKKGRLALGVVVVSAAVALAGCSSSNPLDAGSTPASSSGPIVIGSQAYYSNEIIAEIYAQALEAKNIPVTRQFNIGQRDAYIPSLQNGSVQLFPEYSGNLLQYFDKTATATTPDAVYAALQKALPAPLEALNQSTASDQDSYNVTKAFSDQYGVKSLADLSKVTVPITVAGNSELQTRPYGPDGLKSAYGVTVGFTPIEDSGGPLTVKALTDGTVQMADIYSADPNIQTSNLVTLADPKGLFLSSNVVPIINKNVASPQVTDIINKISAAMTPADLISLNSKSVNDKEATAQIAKDWLTSKGLN
jgi:osmoprotectant transport system substrate-binding protein